MSIDGLIKIKVNKAVSNETNTNNNTIQPKILIKNIIGDTSNKVHISKLIPPSPNIILEFI